MESILEQSVALSVQVPALTKSVVFEVDLTGPNVTASPVRIDPLTQMRCCGLTFQRSELDRLEKGQQLNDNLIYFYCRHLAQSIEIEDLEASSFRPYILNLYSTAKFMSYYNGENQTDRDALIESAKSATEIAQYTNVFAPYNLNDSHWILIELDVARKRILVYDSLQKCKDYAAIIHRSVRALMIWYLSHLEGKVHMESYNKWTWVENVDCPQQVGGLDCGVFTAFALRSRLFRTLPYDQSMMIKMRNSMKVVIENDIFSHNDEFSPKFC